MGKSPFCALGIESPKSLTDTRCCLLSICIDGAVKCTGAQLQTHTQTPSRILPGSQACHSAHVYCANVACFCLCHFAWHLCAPHTHASALWVPMPGPAHGWPFMCIHARQGSCHNEANRIYGTQIQLPVRVTLTMVCIGVRSRPQQNRVRKLAADAHQCVPHIRCRQGHLVRMCQGNLHICED